MRSSQYDWLEGVFPGSMTKLTKTQLLYALLGLFIVASMTYYVMGLIGVYQRIVHIESHPRYPFNTDEDNDTVTTMMPEATAAGLHKGDRLVTFNGKPFHGNDDWIAVLAGGRDALHAGDTLALTVRRADGTPSDLKIVLTKRERLKTALMISGFIVEVLPPLICLFIGYWVAWARPYDWNAWLLLFLMTFVEVLYDEPNWWPGAWHIFLGAWYVTFQALGILALLMFGINFPERWRLDAKLPWLKWLIIVPISLCYPLIVWLGVLQNCHQELIGPRTLAVDHGIDYLINPLNLLCVLVYWAAVLDKLRSSTTADARRRMRVIAAGSVIGLGSLLIVSVLLPHFVSDPHRLQPVRLVGAFLITAFPFSLAYVVVVQRALDVRILVRMGTRYALARASIVILQFAVAIFIVVRFLLPVFNKKQDLSVAIPVTVLVVAGLIKLFASRNSVSERLKQWLDRKFFREAYNAEVVLSELSEQARGFTEAGPLIDTITRRISEVLHVKEVCVFLRGAGTRGVHVFQLQQAVGFPLQTSIHFLDSSSTIRNLARSNRPATLYREDPDGWFLLADEGERKTLDALRAEVLLPLAGRDRLLGVMTLGAKRSEEAYSPTDLRLLQSVSTQTGLALELSELIHRLARQASERERIDREIEIAREVQERLFPQEIPVITGLTLAGHCRPAQGVGGDYYDFIELDDGLLGLAIGDISGKGISAALLMASLRASLRGVTMDKSNDLANVMEKVNRLVFEASANNRYATFFFAIFDPKTLKMRFVNAGHNSPIVVRGATTLSLDDGGPVVGLLEFATYEEQHIQLQAGDLFVGYTDGISEAMTHADEEWGEDRMIASATCVKKESAADILKCIFDAADAFTAGAPQHDDMTLLLMKLADPEIPAAKE